MKINIEDVKKAVDTAVDDVKLQFLADGSIDTYHSSYVYTNKYEMFLEDM